MNHWVSAIIILLWVVFIPTVHIVEKNCEDQLGSNGAGIVADVKNTRAKFVCSHFEHLGLSKFARFTHKLEAPKHTRFKSKPIVI
jgi:hypothetical protein